MLELVRGDGKYPEFTDRAGDGPDGTYVVEGERQAYEPPGEKRALDRMLWMFAVGVGRAFRSVTPAWWTLGGTCGRGDVASESLRVRLGLSSDSLSDSTRGW